MWWQLSVKNFLDSCRNTWQHQINVVQHLHISNDTELTTQNTWFYTCPTKHLDWFITYLSVSLYKSKTSYDRDHAGQYKHGDIPLISAHLLIAAARSRHTSTPGPFVPGPVTREAAGGRITSATFVTFRWHAASVTMSCRVAEMWGIRTGVDHRSSLHFFFFCITLKMHTNDKLKEHLI